MARKVEIIDLQVQYESINGLEQRLSQVNEELKQTKIGSEAFNTLTQEAQQLTAALGNVQKQVEGLTLDKKIQATDGVLKGFSGTIQGVVGGLGLLGIESEKFGEFEKKAASAIAFGMGLKDVAEGFKQVQQSSILAEIATKAFGTTTRAALVATGIGAFVVALGLVVAYWEDITELVSGVSAQQKDLLATQQASVKASEDSLAAISESENTLRLQGKTEKEILDLKIKGTEEVINGLEAQLISQKEIQKTQIETAERNKAILQGLVRLVTIPITAVLAAIDLAGKALGQNFGLEAGFSGGIAGLVFDPEGVKKEGDAANKELESQLTKLRNQRDGFILTTRDIDRRAAEAKKEDKGKEVVIEDENAKKILEIAKRLAAERELLDKDEFERRRILIERQFQENTALLDKESQAYKDADAIRQAALQQVEADAGKASKAVQDSIQRIIDASKLQEEDPYKVLEQQQAIALAEIELLGATEEQKQQIRENFAQKRKQLEELDAEERKDLEEQVTMAKLDQAGQAFGAVATLLGEGSKLGRAFAVAEATTSAIGATVEAYKTGLKNPISVLFPAYPYIQAGIAAAFGVAQVRKIASTKPGSNNLSSLAATKASTSVPAPVSTSIPTLPQVPIVAPAVKAYVLSGDVRNAQEADAKLSRRRTLE
jgi:hypothetical protein